MFYFLLSRHFYMKTFSCPLFTYMNVRAWESPGKVRVLIFLQKTIPNFRQLCIVVVNRKKKGALQLIIYASHSCSWYRYKFTYHFYPHETFQWQLKHLWAISSHLQICLSLIWQLKYWQNAWNDVWCSGKCRKSREINYCMCPLQAIHNGFSLQIGPNDIVCYDVT